MKKTRGGIFETNSSSTHTFTVVNDGLKREIKPEIEPDWYAEFGWQFDNWNTPEEKLAYILRCLVNYEYLYDPNHNWDSDIERRNFRLQELLTPFQKRMENLGVKFKIPTDSDMEKGYVDHGDWYKEEIEKIIENDDDLLNFLFNSNCEINGGNDNC